MFNVAMLLLSWQQFHHHSIGQSLPLYPLFEREDLLFYYYHHIKQNKKTPIIKKKKTELKRGHVSFIH